MRPRRIKRDPDKAAKILADAQRNRVEREKGYREKALALFPHVCGKCGREFSGKNLRELTVHHKDHNHDYNPPDGSNWELLCVYCHDDEHQKSLSSGYHGVNAGAVRRDEGESLGFRPFAALKDALGSGSAAEDESVTEPDEKSDKKSGE